MITVLINVVAPVFLMATMGTIIARIRQVPSHSISQVTLYIFSPALVCHSLIQTALPTGELGQIALYSGLLALALYTVVLMIGKVFSLSQSTRSAFYLTTLFMNAGNYGIPMSLFAFGQEGMERAIVFFVVQATLAGTLATYLASRSHLNPKQAFRSVFKIPMLYAGIAGLVMNLLGYQPPAVFDQPLKILGGAAVPCMLIVLGIQLSGAFSLREYKGLLAVCLIRLVLSAVVAFLLTWALNISGLTQQVLIVVSAMPTAVYTIILATEFRSRPEFVTNAVVATTILSAATLTPLITLTKLLADS